MQTKLHKMHVNSDMQHCRIREKKSSWRDLDTRRRPYQQTSEQGWRPRHQRRLCFKTV